MPVKEINVTVKVEFTRWYKLQFWLGKQLLMLLARLWSAEYTLVGYRDNHDSFMEMNDGH